MSSNRTISIGFALLVIFGSLMWFMKDEGISAVVDFYYNRVDPQGAPDPAMINLREATCDRDKDLKWVCEDSFPENENVRYEILTNGPDSRYINITVTDRIADKSTTVTIGMDGRVKGGYWKYHTDPFPQERFSRPQRIGEGRSGQYEKLADGYLRVVYEYYGINQEKFPV